MESFKQTIKSKTDAQLLEISLNKSDYQKQFIEIVDEEIAIRGLNAPSIVAIENETDINNNNQFVCEEHGNKTWIAIWFIIAFLGGLLSIIAGYTYAFSKKINSNGDKFYTYDKETRDSGKLILIIGVIVLILVIFYKISGSWGFLF